MIKGYFSASLLRMSDDKNFGVYGLFRPNGQICYIGKGRKSRPSEHFKNPKKHKNKHLGSIIANAGGFLEVQWLIFGVSEAEALDEEIRLIAKIGRGKSGPLVNLTDGGDGVCGLKHSAETKNLLAILSKGKKYSAETIAKRASKIRGRKMPPRSQDWKVKRAAFMTGRKQSEETKAKRSAALMGRKFSQESKNKIGSALRGRVHTEQSRANMAAAHVGHRASDETKAKMSAARKGENHWRAKKRAAEWQKLLLMSS